MDGPTVAALALIALPALCFGYAYIVYPAILWVLTRGRPATTVPPAEPDGGEWPTISISLPAFNEEGSIATTLDSLLRIDYPPERRQIVVVSDASTDGTDDVVRSYADRGVELVRVGERRGKTAAEAAAIPHLTGEIVVNTDATITIPPSSVKPLVRAFRDARVGVSSGRDVSVSGNADGSARPESGYVGYEMWLRSLETRFGSIVGASGCFYAIRRPLHLAEFPEELSRDFASCMIARERGYRSVSVDEAVCYVPRAGSLDREYRRKVRTMARGLSTLWYKRALLDPLRYGRFSWMLASHKLARWLVWLTWPLGLAGLGMLAWKQPAIWPLVALAVLGFGVGFVRWKVRAGGERSVLDLPAYAVASAVAGLAAWGQALSGRNNAVWEPTRR